ncbi:hypothetical protein [Roseivivax sp. CAU 1761]
MTAPKAMTMDTRSRNDPLRQAELSLRKARHNSPGHADGKPHQRDLDQLVRDVPGMFANPV